MSKILVPYINRGYNVVTIPYEKLDDWQIIETTNIARVPNTASKFPLLQYLGGHSKRLIVRFRIFDINENDEVEEKFLKAITEAHKHARLNKPYSAYSGTFVYIPMLSELIAGVFFNIVSVKIETIPGVPEGRSVTLELVDITNLRNEIKKRLEFGMSVGYGADFINLIKDTEIKVSKAFVDNIKESIKKDKKYFLEICSRDNVGHDATSTTIKIKLIDEKSKELSSKYFEKFSTEVEIRYYDKYNLIDDIIKVKNDSNITFKKIDDITKADVNIYDLFTEAVSLDSAITKTVSSPKLFTISIDGKKGTIINNLEGLMQFNESAYLDFDLPPNVNPDVYFYQPKTGDKINIKKEDIDKLIEKTANLYYNGDKNPAIEKYAIKDDLTKNSIKSTAIVQKGDDDAIKEQEAASTIGSANINGLKIATWNIQQKESKSIQSSIAKLVSDNDIVVLNEVKLTFLNRLDYYGNITYSKFNDDSKFGTVVIVNDRNPISKISLDNDSQQRQVIVNFSAYSSDYKLIGAHLYRGSDQLNDLLNKYSNSKYSNVNIIIIGDLNIDARDVDFGEFNFDIYTIGDTQKSNALDYMLIKRAQDSQNNMVYGQKGDKEDSDHNPISFEITPTMISQSVIDQGIAYQKAVEKSRSPALTLLNAFPAFKVYIIEDDESDAMDYIKIHDLNDYYGLNFIEEIDFHEMQDAPASTLMFSFIDLTGRYTSAKYYDKPGMETKDPKKIDTQYENKLRGIILKPGCRLQLKIGYGNNVNLLPTKFNGLIASVEGWDNKYTITAQSYGVESVYDVKNPREPEDITSFNPNTEEILNWALTQTEMRHFGRWKLISREYLQGTDTDFGISPFDYERIRADGKRFERLWVPVQNNSDLNVYSPIDESFAGGGDYIRDWSPIRAIGTWFGIRYQQYMVYKKTPWEVIQEMTYRWPGYIAYVIPFGDRVSLFYGPPNAPYYSRPFTYNEGLIADLSSGAKNDSTKELLLQQIRNMTVEGSFRRRWTAMTGINLLFNKVKADYRDVYTAVEVIYDENDESIKMKLNDFLKAEEVRTHVLSAPNVDIPDGAISSTEPFTISTKDYSVTFKERAGGGAYQYGTADLFKQVKKLYKGSLSLMVSPEIKPFDQIYLIDKELNMSGQIEVREHIINFNKFTGMVSTIVPGTVAYVSDAATMTLDDFSDIILSTGSVGDYGNKYLKQLRKEKESLSLDIYEFLSSPGFNAGVMGTSLGVTSIFFTLNPFTIALSIIGGLTFWLSSIAARTTIVSAAKYASPILIRPLTVKGIPYLYGIDSYHLGTIVEAEKEKLNDIGKSFNTLSHLLTSIFSTDKKTLIRTINSLTK